MQTVSFPFARACDECGDPIDGLASAAGRRVCNKLTCLGAAQLRERRAREQARLEAARRQLTVIGVDPEATPWSLVPSNRNPAVPLSAESRAAFIANLSESVAAARRGDGSTEVPEWLRGRPVEEAEAEPLLAGCIACRGYCCLAGGTKAFLSPSAIRRVWPSGPEAANEEEIIETYRRHLPDEHIEDGCVFQGAEGCVLPRDLRSPTCNLFLCPDMRVARTTWLESDSPGAPYHFVSVPELGDPEVAEVATVRIPALVNP